MKLHLGSRARRQAEKKEAWWAANRPAAQGMFAREFRDTLAVLVTTPGAGVAWPTERRPTLRRILMPETQNHIYFRVDDTKQCVHVLAVWGVRRGRSSKR